MRTYAFKCPKGKFHMSLLSKRLVGIAASTALLSLVSASANAQIDVLTDGGSYTDKDQTVIATYTFNRSMTLTSVGFVDPLNNNLSMKYFINGAEQSYSNSVSSAVGGVRWLTLSSPITLQENDVLTVSTLGIRVQPPLGMPAKNQTYLKKFSSTNASAYVTFGGTNALQDKIWSNSNLRVSNPSANVAPEPGSFALALTGGVALLGICIRRSRCNAG
jgi:hypothetical protein